MADMPVIERGSPVSSLVIPLWCRAQCRVLYPQLGVGEDDAETVSRLRADFTAARQSEPLLYALRQDMLASRLEAYLASHPRAVLIDLGCGLDTLLRRMDNGCCRRIYVDLPEAMALREKLLPAREREEYVAADARKLPRFEGIDPAEGVYIVMSGLSCHLTPDENRALISALARTFPGARVGFDALGAPARLFSSSMGIRSYLPRSGAVERWEGVSGLEMFTRLPEKYACLPRAKRLRLAALLALGVLRVCELRLA